MSTENLGFEIAETANALRRAFDRRAAKVGVTRAQWRTLLTLSKNPSVRQVEIAEKMDIEPITLCRMVDRLEEAGLVERLRDPADRRAWRLMLTERATPLLDDLRDLATDLGAEAFDGFEPAQIDALRSGLARIRENLSRSSISRDAKPRSDMSHRVSA